MNRRSFFGAFAAAPLVAVGAKAAPPEITPHLGELRAVVVTLTDQFNLAHSCVGTVETHIWNGDAWVNQDSFEGIDAHNRAMRLYRS